MQFRICENEPQCITNARGVLLVGGEKMGPWEACMGKASGVERAGSAHSLLLKRPCCKQKETSEVMGCMSIDYIVPTALGSWASKGFD